MGANLSKSRASGKEELGKELAQVLGVDERNGVSAYAVRYFQITYEGRKLGVKAFDTPPPGFDYRTLDVHDRPRKDAGRELYHSQDPTVIVSENFVSHFKKKTGDRVELPSPSEHRQVDSQGRPSCFPIVLAAPSRFR